MLDIVEVRTPLGALLSLPLENPTSGFVVEKIDGLDPGKATLVATDYAQSDGAQYRGGRVDARNIKFQIALDPDYVSQSMDSLRQQLYSFFMPKSTVNLRFRVTQILGGPERVRDISGIVEDLTLDLWSEKCIANISIMCYDPYFSEPSPVIAEGVMNNGSVIVDNPGSIPVGFKFTMVNAPQLYGFTFTQRLVAAPPQTSFTVYGEFQGGDVVTVNSIFGQKSIVATQGGTSRSMLGSMQPGSTWLRLGLGRNLITVPDITGGQRFAVEFTAKYGGL